MLTGCPNPPGAIRLLKNKGFERFERSPPFRKGTFRSISPGLFAQNDEFERFERSLPLKYYKGRIHDLSKALGPAVCAYKAKCTIGGGGGLGKSTQITSLQTVVNET